MTNAPAIALLGTFDAEGEEHHFPKAVIEKGGHRVLHINDPDFAGFAAEAVHRMIADAGPP